MIRASGALVVIATLLGSIALPACSRPKCDDAEVGDKPVDQRLVAYLSMASALHHEADLAESRNDGAGALAALVRLIDAPIPGSYTEVREVRADTLARAGELSMQQRAFERAGTLLARGLDEVPEENYYRGRLLEVSGLLLEAESKQLEADGKLAEAEAKKRDAIGKLEQAVRIQQAVIERSTPPKESP